jgi:hypothetical protein
MTKLAAAGTAWHHHEWLAWGIYNIKCKIICSIHNCLQYDMENDIHDINYYVLNNMQAYGK